MNDVLITVKGTQTANDGPEVIELTTQGKLAYKDDKVFISYKSDDVQNTNVSTTIKLDSNDRIIVLRSGGIESKMVIEKGKKSKCFYSVSNSDLVLNIYGEKIENNIENNGILVFEYTIDIDNTFVSRNRIEIYIKEV